MIRKIKSTIIIATLTLCSVGAPGLIASGVAFAGTGCSSSQSSVNNGANLAFGNSGCALPSSSNGNSVSSVATTVVNILSLIVGILAVIMIIYGGLRYISSGGSSEGVGNAKNTIIYAIIGLIIVALAQLIVHFVLNAAINNNTGTA